jgi:hypothetical protein
MYTKFYIYFFCLVIFLLYCSRFSLVHRDEHILERMRSRPWDSRHESTWTPGKMTEQRTPCTQGPLEAARRGLAGDMVRHPGRSHYARLPGFPRNRNNDRAWTPQAVEQYRWAVSTAC